MSRTPELVRLRWAVPLTAAAVLLTSCVTDAELQKAAEGDRSLNINCVTGPWNDQISKQLGESSLVHIGQTLYEIRLFGVSSDLTVENNSLLRQTPPPTDAVVAIFPSRELQSGEQVARKIASMTITMTIPNPTTDPSTLVIGAYCEGTPPPPTSTPTTQLIQ